MKSLSAFNTFGQTALDVTDARPSGVKFDRAFPPGAQDQVITISNNTYSPDAAINITEVINYQTANVRYRVKIVTGGATPLVNSTITWDSLPSGVTLTEDGTTYTLSGITNPNIWQAVKIFNWNLPSNYADYGLWYLEVAIVYYDDSISQDREVDWLVYDERFYWVSQMTSSFSSSCEGIRAKVFTVDISGSGFTQNTIGVRAKGLILNAASTSTVLCEPNVNVDNIYLTTTMSVTGDRVMISRPYKEAQANQLFFVNNYLTTNTPSATFSVTLSSTIGTFSTSEYTLPTSPWTTSGTLSEVNDVLTQVRFYPNEGQSSNGTFAYLQQADSVTQDSQTVTLTGTAQAFQPQTITFTSNTSWTPTVSQWKYSTADILVVGGGGCGGWGSYSPPNLDGGGGGGGGVLQLFSQQLSSQVYSITIGQGGDPNGTYNYQRDGGNSSFGANIAYGGKGAHVDTIGGASGAPTTNTGTDTSSGGGGGAGGSATGTYAGPGLLSTITNKYYGGGGTGGGTYRRLNPAVGGGGIGGAFDVVDANYRANLIINFSNGQYTSVSISDSGKNYAVDDEIFIFGDMFIFIDGQTIIEGTSPANDLKLRVTSVDPNTRGITGVEIISGSAYPGITGAMSHLVSIISKNNFTKWPGEAMGNNGLPNTGGGGGGGSAQIPGFVGNYNYNRGDIMQSGSISYFCIKDHKSEATFTFDPSYWKQSSFAALGGYGGSGVVVVKFTG